MNKKQNYTAPKVENVLVFPQEPVLGDSSPIVLSAMTIADPATPAVESADFSSNVAW